MGFGPQLFAARPQEFAGAWDEICGTGELKCAEPEKPEI
jgi:hypothetical protein